METTRESYPEKMEAQLKQWSTRLEVLKARAEKAGMDTRTELLAALAELEKLAVAGRQHFATIRTATAWGEMKTELAEQWNHVSGAADAIWAKVS